jgi:hypothetical protein
VRRFGGKPGFYWALSHRVTSEPPAHG